MASRRITPPIGGLVLVRVALGALLLAPGYLAVETGAPDGFELERVIRSSVAELSGLLAWWGEAVLLYNPDATAFILRWCAFLLGAALMLGAFTRPAGWLAALLLLHLWAFGPAGGASGALLGALCAVACAVSDAGHSLGLDRWLDDRVPRIFGRRGRRSFLD